MNCDGAIQRAPAADERRARAGRTLREIASPGGLTVGDVSDYNLIELLDRIYLNQYCCPRPPKWTELSNHVCSTVDHAKQQARYPPYASELSPGRFDVQRT